MTTIAFFNNKGGVGKTSLVYHLAHMFPMLGKDVLLLDLDPQSNLTAMCLPEEDLEELWDPDETQATTIARCMQPLLRGIGDIATPGTRHVADGVTLVPGDLSLSRVEDRLSDAWPRAVGGDEASFRALSAFHRIGRMAQRECGAALTLLDVGPNLGAINRAALLGADYVITPLAPDLFSIQGLRNLGPTLTRWRKEWRDRIARNPDPSLELPSGKVVPLGYVVMQTGLRLSRPVKAYDRWVQRIPTEFTDTMLRPLAPDGEPPQASAFLGVLRHYQSLMPLAQDAQKPMFLLRPADGAIGAHMEAVRRCEHDFRELARAILEALDVKTNGQEEDT